MNDPVSANTRAACAAAGSKAEQHTPDDSEAKDQILGLLGPFMDQMREIKERKLSFLRYEKNSLTMRTIQKQCNSNKTPQEEGGGSVYGYFVPHNRIPRYAP